MKLTQETLILKVFLFQLLKLFAVQAQANHTVKYQKMEIYSHIQNVKYGVESEETHQSGEMFKSHLRGSQSRLKEHVRIYGFWREVIQAHVNKRVYLRHVVDVQVSSKMDII